MVGATAAAAAREDGSGDCASVMIGTKGPGLNNRIGRKESRVREERNERIWKLA
jgi:hypothetical protein